MIRVGCCGFPTSMNRYFESFHLVELNSTFYRYPRPTTVEGWRKRAPKSFEFTVKAHQDISHKARLKVDKTGLEAFQRMGQICKTLGSKILLIQTPGSFKPDSLEDVERFLGKVDRGDLVLVWETRGPAWEAPAIRKKLGQTLEELDVGHVTDPFKTMPAHTSKIAYFRLHGLGQRMYYYQYSDLELQKLEELVAPFEAEGKDVYVLFNNLSMFEDALRFKEYLSTDAFSRVTSSTGLASIREVAAKVQFPISGSALIRKVGWRLVELEDGRQMRFDAAVEDLPSRIFKDVEELLREIESACKVKA